MSETMAEWLVKKGKAEGNLEGQLSASKDHLRIFLETRFGTLPDSVVQRIEAATDLNRLKNCIRQAGQLNSLEELPL